jgi:flagellar biogenesis protein FliO
MSPLARYVIETGITLLAITALVVVTLYGARRLGVGAPQGPLSLVGRLPIDARRAVYLVKVGETVYVLGASEAGLTKLGEVDGSALPAAPSTAPLRFVDVLGKLKRGGEAS